MADKPKRQMNPKSLENLKPMSERTRAERQELGKKGAEVTNRIKAEKKSREEGNVFIWDRYFSTGEKMDEFWNSLTPKDKAAILMSILPKDKQVNELIGSIGIQKVFVTPEMIDEAKEKTKELLEDG